MSQSRPRRGGSSLLEIQVAMIVLGVALSGLCPLVVMQLRVLRKFESQALGNNYQVIQGVRILDVAPPSADGTSSPPAMVLLPQPDAWVRRLGVYATFTPGATIQTYTPMPVQAKTDDSGPGFASPGWSTNSDPAAEGGSYHELDSGSGVGPASWTFGGLIPGRYTVYVRYVPDPLNATDATYSLIDGGGRPVSQAVDQTAAPVDMPPYKSLGAYYLGSTAQVLLGAGPSKTGQLGADAVQLVPAGPANSITITAPPASPPSSTTPGALQVRAVVTPR